MIQEIPDYSYLGNGIETFNSNMKELNVRMDRLYSQSVSFNRLGSQMEGLSSNFLNFITTVQNLSAKWQAATDTVYSAQGYWQEPIMLVYKNTFNVVANFQEIETWINNNFPASDFIENQVIGCDYSCKNYSTELLTNRFILSYDPDILSTIATSYNTTIRDIQDFKSYKNQIDSIIICLNNILRKYNLKDLFIQTYEQLAASKFSTYTSYNQNTQQFEAINLPGFSQLDLKFFDSYSRQFDAINVKYAPSHTILGLLPDTVLIQFVENVEIISGGRFYYKILNGRWTYYPYTHIEFCPTNICSDCFNNIPIVVNRDCPLRFKYLLQECVFFNPYTEIPTPTISALSIEPDVKIIPEYLLEEYDFLSHLFS
jgi:hypothetical protein